jgi:hypothetical protein
MNVDIAIVALVCALAIALHVVLFVLFRRWMDRDLALSFAGEDPHKRDHMLQCLRQAQHEGVKRRELPAWLARAAGDFRAAGADQAIA